MSDTPTDGRRAAGARTRTRILETVQTLLSERVAEAITLKDITEAANVNVASVAYYFGSKDELLREATEDGVRRFAGAYAGALEALPPNATVRSIAEALAKTIISWLTSRDIRERNLAAVHARSLLSADESVKYEEATRDLFARLTARLRRALPDARTDELQFRTHAAMTILRACAAGVVGFPLERRSSATLLRLVVPAVTGCLLGDGRGDHRDVI